MIPPPQSPLTQRAQKEAGTIQTWGGVRYAQRVQTIRAVSIHIARQTPECTRDRKLPASCTAKPSHEAPSVTVAITRIRKTLVAMTCCMHVC